MAIERKISGCIYRFEELQGWPAHDALALLLEIAGPLAPALEAAFVADKVERSKTLVRLIPAMLKNHNPDKLRELFDLLIQNCRADGQPAIVGVRPGPLDEMFQVLTLCIEGQFVPFFQGEGVSRLLAMLPTDSSETENSAA